MDRIINCVKIWRTEVVLNMEALKVETNSKWCSSKRENNSSNKLILIMKELWIVQI